MPFQSHGFISKSSGLEVWNPKNWIPLKWFPQAVIFRKISINAGTLRCLCTMGGFLVQQFDPFIN